MQYETILYNLNDNNSKANALNLGKKRCFR